MVAHSAIKTRLKHSRAHVLQSLRKKACAAGYQASDDMTAVFTKPLLFEENPLRPSGESDQFLNGREESKAETMQSLPLTQSQCSNHHEPEEKDQSWSAMLRWHNVKLQILYAMGYCKLVNLDYRTVSVSEDEDEKAPLLVTAHAPIDTA
jgi:hypothetical protein